jgi:peptide-methionine (S)-S-oxide reductase
MRLALAFLAVTAIAAVALHHPIVAASETARALPKPAVDEPLASAGGQQTAVVAGGCFWGIQAVFQHVQGVISATAGYSGGAAGTADYETVSTGETGHAESVKIVFDPSKVTYGELLQVFFSVAHDPTQLNRQGPDDGTQYRSVIFYANDEQQRIAQDYIAQLDKAKAFPQNIVTQVAPLKAFYPAEAYHQNFAARHPDNPYIACYDLPKVANLQHMFPQLYRKQ